MSLEAQLEQCLSESEALHRRVRAFAESASESFEDLALDIARFQALHQPGFRRLCALHGSLLDRLSALPALPTETFRIARVAVHPAKADWARFFTSGTSGGPRGVHALRTAETYRALALRSAEPALIAPWPGPRVVLALAPVPDRPWSSSLGFMMALFIEHYDGRSLGAIRFDVFDPNRWLVGPDGVNLRAVRSGARIALDRREPLLVLGTAFALAAMLDALGGERVEAPERTVVMVTGGFKGRRRDVDPEELRRAVAHVFTIPEAQVVGEYGMTELTSELYERTLSSAEGAQPFGVYVEPPWVRVDPVQPSTLLPVADGDVGLARIVDLGNVDSAVAILTEDLVRREAGGIRLMGRRLRAEPRGCSLAVEDLVISAAESDRSRM